MTTLERFRDEGVEFGSSEECYAAAVPVEAMRRAQLRRDLGLGLLVEAVRGDGHIRLRSCLLPFPSTMRGCRCAEDAIVEVAASVQRVDPSAVAAARARAEVLHARVVRRLERARTWLRRRRTFAVTAPSIVPSAVRGRRVVGLADVGIPDGLVDGDRRAADRRGTWVGSSVEAAPLAFGREPPDHQRGRGVARVGVPPRHDLQHVDLEGVADRRFAAEGCVVTASVRENAASKARRYLGDGRVRGDGAAWSTGRDEHGWFCTCPARGRCAHLIAVGLIVALEPREAL